MPAVAARAPLSSAVLFASAAVLGALGSTVLFVPGLASPLEARAAVPEVLPPAVRVSARERPGEGSLTVWQGEEMLALPLLDTAIEAEISGAVAVVELRQRFANPLDQVVEARYALPLPAEGAVDRMQLRVEGRVIEGRLQRKEEARAVYEEARAQGQTAALLEQERSNLFQQSIANVQPGEIIEVELRLVAPLVFEDGEYRWSFPLTIGPRFQRGVPDPAITPLVAPARRSGRAVALTVSLDSGVDHYDLDSPTHAVEVAHEGPGRAQVWLEPHDSVPNRDFELRWRTAGLAPAVAIQNEPDGVGGGWFSLLLEPPAEWQEERIEPRELFFVIDASCSMAGAPLRQARRVVHEALDRLRPDDRFQLIQFSDAANRLAAAPLAVSEEARRQARSFLDGLNGHGGTQMRVGVEQALAAPDPERQRTVLFLTDGFIGAEGEVLEAIERQLGTTRLFALGLGSSPNRALLGRMATLGRGAVQYALPEDNAAAVAELFIDRVAHPLLVDIELAWEGVEVDQLHPPVVPDLYGGQPVRVMGRYRDGAPEGRVILRGTLGGEPVELTQPVSWASPGVPGIASLWARRRIEEIELRRIVTPSPAWTEAIVELSLAHDVLSSETAFVAVERRRRSDGSWMELEVPVELPAGMEEGLLGSGRGGGGFGMGGLGVTGQGMAGGGASYGTGGASYGTGYGRGLGTRSAPSVSGTVRGSAPEVMGALDRSVIARVIRGARAPMRTAYERQLQNDPDLEGRVVMELAIGADGRVLRAVAVEDELHHEELIREVARVLMRLRFPETSGGVVVVRYPLVFQSE